VVAGGLPAGQAGCTALFLANNIQKSGLLERGPDYALLYQRQL